MTNVGVNRNLNRLFPASSNFNLNIVHPPSAPYLGISMWEPIDEQENDNADCDDDMNILDMSNILHGPDESPSLPLTPPRLAALNASTGMGNGHVVSSPSFLLRNAVSFSSPKLKRSQGSSFSSSSVRTATTTSTAASNSVNAADSHFRPRSNDVTITFAPRRLFDPLDDGDGDDCNRNFYSAYRSDIETTRNDLTTTTISSGAASPSISSPISYSGTPSKSIDQSIIIRNGVLVKESLYSPISTCRSPSTLSSRHVPDGIERNNMKHLNTLPSFKEAQPIRLKIKESYAGYSTGSTDDEEDGLNTSNLSMLSDAEQEHFFSYDPYFSLGQYIISTPSGNEYGNGLSVKMGERYMTLQDGNGRVWGIMRSRHTWIPSSVIYSPKARYLNQTPSSHRPCGDDIDGGGDGVELYPWAMVKKHGRRMDHDVSIHIVAESGTSSELVGGLFEKTPSLKSRHGFDDRDNHQHTIVYRINGKDEIPCCMMVRDPIKRDVFDVTIAPGIDPLMIICYMAVHSKMVSTLELHTLNACFYYGDSNTNHCLFH